MPDLGIKILFEGTNMLRLLGGLWVTVRISLVSVVLSIGLGTLLGLVMTRKNPLIRAVTHIYLKFIFIMPQLVLLFIVFFGSATAFGMDLSGEVAAVIVFVLWGTAEMGDLVRGAVISIPKHQYDSAAAIGLEPAQIYRHIIIPQTLRRLIPLAINLVTRMIKTTSLVVLIGVVEVLKVGEQIIDANRLTTPSGALWIYSTVFFLYFIVCYPISRLASRLEKRWQ